MWLLCRRKVMRNKGLGVNTDALILKVRCVVSEGKTGMATAAEEEEEEKEEEEEEKEEKEAAIKIGKKKLK